MIRRLFLVGDGRLLAPVIEINEIHFCFRNRMVAGSIRYHLLCSLGKKDLADRIRDGLPSDDEDDESSVD